MNKYAYYQCFKCGDPYYGGEAIYQPTNIDKHGFDPSELMRP